MGAGAPLPSVAPLTKRYVVASIPSGFGAILGSKLLEIWYPADASLSGGRVDAINGALAGIALPSPGAGERPAYDASDTDFNGRPTFRTEVDSSNSYLANNTATGADAAALGPSGTHHNFIFCVARLMSPGAQANDKCLMQLGLWGGATDRNLMILIGTSGQQRSYLFNGAANYVDGGAVDGAMHLFGAYALGSSLYTVRDTTVTSAALSGSDAWSGPATNGRVFAGSRSANPGYWIDAEYAVLGVCSEPPSASELTAMSDYVRSAYADVPAYVVMPPGASNAGERIILP